MDHFVKKYTTVLNKNIQLGHDLKQEVTSLLGENGIILYPPYPEPAPPHFKPLLTVVSWIYTAIWNVMELPATQVPLGLSKKGLPLGVQVIGGRGKDHQTISVALELERKFGGWAHRD